MVAVQWCVRHRLVNQNVEVCKNCKDTPGVKKTHAAKIPKRGKSPLSLVPFQTILYMGYSNNFEAYCDNKEYFNVDS